VTRTTPDYHNTNAAQTADGRDSLAHALGVIAVAVWVLLLVAVTIGGCLFLVKVGEAKDALFQCAAAAIASTVFVGLYIATRCLEKILGGVDRIRRRS
jgi:hypothetical protein